MNKSDIPRIDYKSRLERWEENAPLPLIIIGEGGPILDFAEKFWEEKGDTDSTQNSSLSESSIVRGSREIVFSSQNSELKLHFVMYGLDSEDLLLQISPTIESVALDEEDLLEKLAIARIYEVPVVANTPQDAPLLAKYHRRMLTDGFQIGNNLKRYQLTKKIDLEISGKEVAKELNAAQLLTPAEMHLIQENIVSELSALSRADKLLSGLDFAINELERKLNSTARNESDLQRCLTDNPILFGLDYSLVKPKHDLGSEYEMDYALVRWDGQIDLVEIEASTHKLFTNKLNPTANLVHAEQQVLDWLEWIEKNLPYARENLPGISKPVGFVIIGRTKDMPDKAVTKLRFRNIFFGGKLTILTYDDLLQRAKSIQQVLQVSTKNT